VPTLRGFASFVWTGTELIVCGGMYGPNETPNTPLADGGRLSVIGTSREALRRPSQTVTRAAMQPQR